MSIFKDIKEMVGKRLAYRLWLVKEESDSLVYTDTRALTFVRIMTLFFSLATLSGIVFVSSKGNVPLPVYLILGFFCSVFFILFLVKAFSHKEVEFRAFDKRVFIRKKRFNSVLSERVFNFNQAKKLTLGRVSRIETKDDYGRRIRTHMELVMEFNDDYNIHFSVINDPDAASESARKLADFVGVKLTSRI